MGAHCLLFALISLAWAANVPKVKQGLGLRLIEFNETSRAWMTPNQVLQLAHDRATFMDITDFPHLGSHGVQKVLDIPDKPAFQDIVNPLINNINLNQYMEFLTRLSAFPTRYYTSADGERAVEYLVGEYQRFSSHRSDVSIERFTNTWRQDSIIARIEGEGPDADEVVIIGGHIDSISLFGNAPGADDDGSGSCTVLEVFRTLSVNNFKPKRTIEFHGYSGEEVGLRGSQAIAQSYANRGIKVAGMMQLDMTGYVRSGTTEVIAIITDFVDPELTAFIRELVDTYTNLPWANTQCGYACSDHASWNRAGYRACVPAEGLFSNSNPYIHTSSDVVANLKPSHMLEFIKLGLAYVVELSLAD